MPAAPAPFLWMVIVALAIATTAHARTENRIDRQGHVAASAPDEPINPPHSSPARTR